MPTPCCCAGSWAKRELPTGTAWRRASQAASPLMSEYPAPGPSASFSGPTRAIPALCHVLSQGRGARPLFAWLPWVAQWLTEVVPGLVLARAFTPLWFAKMHAARPLTTHSPPGRGVLADVETTCVAVVGACRAGRAGGRLLPRFFR